MKVRTRRTSKYWLLHPTCGRSIGSTYLNKYDDFEYIHYYCPYCSVSYCTELQSTAPKPTALALDFGDNTVKTAQRCPKCTGISSNHIITHLGSLVKL